MPIAPDPAAIAQLAALSLKSKRDLMLEIVALRAQLEIAMRTNPKPRLTPADRRFFLWLAKVFEGWRECLYVVRPETVVRWHRAGFRWYWR